ncbi:hypothetical protein N7462_007823 [Penicillium macrosclerotiorum]|uniref:uncharacterized protein n=1 Tax=Penicillium macrosclerotiorum TaxID=303699 RepID=UPI002547843F|nr:uncharacterized protein N7462_007823 [Penicillium macrosclerotiorum]KAJ5679579.1 hypothetical protein N7462_007823 [Penicillium macrosclerotiorum]
MAAIATRRSPDLANGNSNSKSVKGARKASGTRDHNQTAPSIEKYGENEAPELHTADDPHPQFAPKATSGPRASGAPVRSFSARAAANLNHTTRKPAPLAPPGLPEESTTPRGLPSMDYPTGLEATAQENEEPMPYSEAPTAPMSDSHSRRDWASDRSPLQKLEVALNGISKEEKRARVQEAEMRLRERLARQKAEKEKAEFAAATAAAAAAANTASRPRSKQSTHTEDQSGATAARNPKQQDMVLEDTNREPPQHHNPS